MPCIIYNSMLQNGDPADAPRNSQSIKSKKHYKATANCEGGPCSNPTLLTRFCACVNIGAERRLCASCAHSWSSHALWRCCSVNTSIQGEDVYFIVSREACLHSTRRLIWIPCMSQSVNELCCVRQAASFHWTDVRSWTVGCGHIQHLLRSVGLSPAGQELCIVCTGRTVGDLSLSRFGQCMVCTLQPVHGLYLLAIAAGMWCSQWVIKRLFTLWYMYTVHVRRTGVRRTCIIV